MVVRNRYVRVGQPNMKINIHNFNALPKGYWVRQLTKGACLLVTALIIMLVLSIVTEGFTKTGSPTASPTLFPTPSPTTPIPTASPTLPCACSLLPDECQIENE